jgi:hypothetical protein
MLSNAVLWSALPGPPGCTEAGPKTGLSVLYPIETTPLSVLKGSQVHYMHREHE